MERSGKAKKNNSAHLKIHKKHYVLAGERLLSLSKSKGGKAQERKNKIGYSLDFGVGSKLFKAVVREVILKKINVMVWVLVGM